MNTKRVVCALMFDIIYLKLKCNLQAKIIAFGFFIALFYH